MPIQKRHFVLNEALNNKELNHYNQSLCCIEKMDLKNRL